MTELRQKLNDKSTFEQAQKQALKQEINKYQMMYEELDDKYKHLLLIQAQQRFKENNQEKNNKNFYQNTMVSKKINLTQESRIFKNELYPRKLRTLRKENVSKFAVQLNMKFRLSKIEMDDIVEKYLFDDNNKKSMMVSIKDLARRF